MATLLTKDKLGEMGLVNNTLKWVYARCPHCGLTYRYPENSLYRPKTCRQYQCVKRNLHSRIIL
jgi:hypothetical protein